MGSLTEDYRPSSWEEVAGQEKAIAKIRQLAKRGLGGRAYWISGDTGTGKTSIARLIAREVSGIGMEEENGKDVKVADLDVIRRRCTFKAIDGRGWVWIYNEAHLLRKDVCDRLLTLLEPNEGQLPDHVAIIFTTTRQREKGLFPEYDDGAALLDRCKAIELARRDLSGAFAARALEIANKEGLAPEGIDNGTLLAWCVKLAKESGNSMRGILQAIEDGYLIDRAERILSVA